jgi:hypothetical protein
MTTVLLAGRKLPAQDWEGDDFTPGAGGKFVTCTDTAAGRAIAYATNGRRVIDGRAIRAAIHPHDPDGATLEQVAQGVHSLTGLELVIPYGWSWPKVMAHLTSRLGLIVLVWYAAIPSSYRFQAFGGFGHAVWLSHLSSTSGMRDWDGLDRNETHHGSWVPASAIKSGMEEWARRDGHGLRCAYVPLQHL